MFIETLSAITTYSGPTWNSLAKSLDAFNGWLNQVSPWALAPRFAQQFMTLWSIAYLALFESKPREWPQK